MKIYFEDGELLPNVYLDFAPLNYCDAKYGYTKNIRLLDKLLEKDPHTSVYTNSLVALHGIYSWNKDIKEFELFMRDKNSNFKSIKETYGKIRPSQNIIAMFQGGCFSS